MTAVRKPEATIRSSTSPSANSSVPVWSAYPRNASFFHASLGDSGSARRRPPSAPIHA
jgi:hypothetical protein